VERRGHPIDGDIDELRAFVVTLADLPIAEVVDRLLERASTQDRNADDVVILAARIP
jgi:hypothetical protein